MTQYTWWSHPRSEYKINAHQKGACIHTVARRRRNMAGAYAGGGMYRCGWGYLEWLPRGYARVPSDVPKTQSAVRK